MPTTDRLSIPATDADRHWYTAGARAAILAAAGDIDTRAAMHYTAAERAEHDPAYRDQCEALAEECRTIARSIRRTAGK